MAVLIQAVQGEQYGRYFFPFGAGVAFSRNLYRWSPQIRKEDGFVRLVWGLGTRAVERVGNDYPRLVALSHPTLQPDDDPHAIRYYSQQNLDLIDLQEKTVKTRACPAVIRPDYPGLRYLAQVEAGRVFQHASRAGDGGGYPPPGGHFRRPAAPLLFRAAITRMLHTLEEHYRSRSTWSSPSRSWTRTSLSPRCSSPCCSAGPRASSHGRRDRLHAEKLGPG